MVYCGLMVFFVFSREDMNLGGVVMIVYIQNQDLYVVNVGDVQVMIIKLDSIYVMLIKKYDFVDFNECMCI